MPFEDSQVKDMKSLVQMIRMKAINLIFKTKVLNITSLRFHIICLVKIQLVIYENLVLLQAACSLSLGLGEESIHTSSLFVMPMVSSKINGFRGHVLDRKFSFRSPGWNRINEDDGEDLLQTSTLLPQTMK